MKNLFLPLFASLILLASCNSNCDKSMVCDGACLFEEHELEATMNFYSCYETWGFAYVVNDSLLRVGLLPDVAKRFQEADLPVRLSATFYENDIPLSFPDPSFFGEMFRAETCELETISP